MNKKPFLGLLLLFLLHSFSIFSQSTIEGYVRDSKTHVVLPYVNIGITGKNVGTVSSEKGRFKIFIDSKYNEDSLRFSMIGYKSKTVKAGDAATLLNSTANVELEEDAIKLEEVVILSQDLKEKILGNETESTSIVAGFSTNELGNEVGIVIKIKNKPAYIQAFNVNIASNKYDTLKFRVNLYSLKDGLPDTSLLKKSIIVNTTLKNGKLSIDLRKYNIIVEEDFFAALEWIEDLGSNGLYFSANFLGSPIIARHTSQGNWEKIGGVSLGFNVKVLQ